MTDDFSTPLLDDDGKLRIRRFAVATLASAIVMAVGVAFAVHTADPSGGWAVAFGIGGMIGFWMCPLAGAVIGNGYHESKEHGDGPVGEAAHSSVDTGHPVAA
jgi:hypothetical protein